MGISKNINSEYLKFTNHFNGLEEEKKEKDEFLKTTRFENK